MRYVVDAWKEGTHWLGEVPQIEGTHTFARSLAALDHEVREAIALALDLPEGGEEALILDWNIAGTSEIVARAFELREKRRAFEAERAAIEAETREVVTALNAEGWSKRDQALFTGLTHARVAQIGA